MQPTKEAFYQALCQRHGEALQEKFTAARVAICGAGGLGSNIAIMLAGGAYVGVPSKVVSLCLSAL